MNASRLLLAVLVLLALVVGLSVYLLGSSATPEAPAAIADGAARPAAVGGENAAEQLESAASAQDVTERSNSGARASALGDGRDVAVVLELPPNAPPDPELALWAVPASALEGTAGSVLLAQLRAGERSDAGFVSAPLSGTRGSVRIPSSMEAPRLLLDGRFLFLKEPTPIMADQTEARLAPSLGASLVVRLTAPANAALDGELSVAGGDFAGGRPTFQRLTLAADSDGPLEFRALDPDLTWSLTPNLETLHGYAEMGLELEAGRERVFELALTRGATVAGVVRDEAGEPQTGVEVRTSGGRGWFGRGDTRSTETDSAGRFELRALAPGEVKVEAVAEGWVDAESETFELADGERADGVQLTMSRGLAIAGQVLGEAGAPTADVRVMVEARSSRGGWGGWGGDRTTVAGQDRTDAEGRFRVSGLDEGKYTVRATLALEDTGGATWRASQEAVPAGSEGLSLQLAGPLPFKGRVIDDRGEPVAEFEIVAESIKEGGPRESQRYSGEDGAFAFARVGPGTWEVTARAEGHERSEPQLVNLPQSEAQLELQLELQLERQAIVAGRVLDANGAPIAGATVRGEDGGGGGNPWMGPRGPQAETDSEGVFELEGIAPGGLALTASAENWADSEELALELAPGELREDVQLSLRVGGGIVGTVVTPEGDPRPGRRVTWGSNAMGFGSRGETTTDAAGSFEFTNVTPGEWSVSAAPSFAEMGRSMRGRSGQTAFIDAMGDLVTETVTVADGEVVEVFLGGEPKRPVRVFGIVSRDGDPISGAQVFAVSEGSAVFEGMKTAMTAEDGTYELTVDRPGPYAISANSGQVGVEAMVDVPRADEARVDLLIPLGRIEGTVRTGRQRAEGVRLSIQREDGLGRMRWAGSQVTSDADGQYAFEDLEAGSYTVRANVPGWGGPGASSADSTWGSEVIGGVVVERDRITSGIDFELETAGSVSGVVRDPSGAPAGGVTVFFRDSAGRLVSSVSGTRTDAAGRFEESGLAPGSYTLSARSEGLAASDATSVNVRSSETTEVEFEVEVGTTLVVTLEDSEGDARRSRVEVIDDAGVEVGGLITVKSLQATFNEGASTREQRVGPLPPGRYTVRATTQDGRSDEKRVSLRARNSEKKVTLRLEE